MKSRPELLALLAICSLLPSPAAAQVRRSPTPRIVTTTRLVAQFSELEQRLNHAIQKKDRAALNELLSDDFEQWTPAPPGDPLPREEWLRNALSAITLSSFELRQMAVRMFGDTAVVSFVQIRRALCDGRDCSGASFIVDLWQESGRAPRLLVRYDSQNLAQQPVTPPSTPTGKE